jgi:hypothetical protein
MCGGREQAIRFHTVDGYVALKQPALGNPICASERRQESREPAVLLAFAAPGANGCAEREHAASAVDSAAIAANRESFNSVTFPKATGTPGEPVVLRGMVGVWCARSVILYAGLFAAAAGIASAQATPSALTPAQQIFDAAFRKWQSYPVPPYAIWTTTWHIRETPMGYYSGSTTSTEWHRYAIRLSDGMENVSNPIPSGKLPPALILPEFLGPFAFRTRSEVHVAPQSTPGASMIPDVSGLKTIATVVAYEKASYTFGNGAAMPPIETVDGRQAYHLTLHPRDKPEEHNLRDLWIDVQTHDIVEAHFVGTYAPFPQAPVSPTEATVYFREVVGCWVVTHANWTYQYPPVLFEFDIASTEIGLPTTLPDWLFDPAQYRQHELAGDPDYVGLELDRMRALK